LKFLSLFFFPALIRFLLKLRVIPGSQSQCVLTISLHLVTLVFCVSILMVTNWIRTANFSCHSLIFMIVKCRWSAGHVTWMRKAWHLGRIFWSEHLKHLSGRLKKIILRQL
jgi:hypothetical protein